jgi:glycerol uptake facilitator-like aquaporin
VSRLDLPANPGGLVYGTILVATLLAAESPKRETYAKTVAAVAISVIVYWLSASYAELTGERIRDEEGFKPAAFARAAAHELPVIFGALGPLLALLVCWVAGAALSPAVTVAIWTAVAMIVATEVVLGMRAELTGRQLVIQTGMGVLLGLLVVALRVLLH